VEVLNGKETTIVMMTTIMLDVIGMEAIVVVTMSIPSFAANANASKVLNHISPCLSFLFHRIAIS